MTKTNGNNNGNGQGVKQQLRDEKMTLDDLVEVSVVSMFFVQKLGKASVEQVMERVQEIHAEINEFLLAQSLEALRGRGLLSYARGAKKDGESIKMYKVTKVKWASPPEVAHIKDLLPALVETDEAKRIISVLNGAEEIGDGESKSKRKLGYAEFWELRTTFRLKNPMLGSQPDSPWMRQIVKDSEIPAPKECDLRFWRDEETGDVMIPSDVVCGWIRTGIRYAFDFGDTLVQYIAADDIRIKPKKLYQVGLPVIDPKDRSGKGITTYELLPRDTEITIHFRVPARGFSDPLRFVMWLAAYAPCPHRGLSPARGRRFGKMEMIDYEILGASASAETALNSVIDGLESPAAKKLYAKLMATAADKKIDFTAKAKGGIKVTDLN